MTVYFDTSDPQALLDRFTKAVKKGSEGSITTWEEVNGAYTHTSGQ